ncbi:MAG: capsule assembly Wzi family protein [Gemmatimonadota bacterium]
MGPEPLSRKWLTARRAAAVALALVGPVAAGGGDATVNVPLDHWSYRVIERFEARGLLSGLGDGIKPFSRGEMARALDRVDSLARAGGAELSRVEAAELTLLRRELSPGAGGLTERARAGWPLAQYHHADGDLCADLLARQQTDQFTGRGRDRAERVYRNRLGGVVWGDVADRMGFRIAFEQTREQGSRTYRLRDDVYEPRLEAVQLKEGVADYHQGSAYVTFSLSPFADVEIGKDQVRWGPAPGDNLGLGDVAPGFEMVRLRARYGALKLVSIAGVLRPCPDRPDSPVCGGEGDSARSYVANGMTRLLDREKYLAAHRLEATVAPWLDLGFQEVLVYGDRGPEPAYLNPLMFYWAAQSYLGDKDNLMMGVDADLHPGNGVRLYLAYVVDDLKKLRIFSNDFANKFSLQAGALWIDPLGRRDVDLRAEYVRIEPWIYTHKYSINTFRHFDGPLGHPLGPNSDQWQLQATRRLSSALAVDLAVSRTRHGSNEVLPDGSVRNVGGDLDRGWRPGDERESKHFLDGVRSRWTRVGTRITWRPWPEVQATAGYEYEWGDHVPLPPRWGPHAGAAEVSGYGDGGQQHLLVDLRYGIY